MESVNLRTGVIRPLASRRIIPTAMNEEGTVEALCPIVLELCHELHRVELDVVLQSHHVMNLTHRHGVPKALLGCGFALFSSLEIQDLYQQVGSTSTPMLTLSQEGIFNVLASRQGNGAGAGVGAAVLRRGPDLRASRIRRYTTSVLRFVGEFVSASASRKADEMKEEDDSREKSGSKDQIPTGVGPVIPSFFLGQPGSTSLVTSGSIVSQRPEDFHLEKFWYNGKHFNVESSVLPQSTTANPANDAFLTDLEYDASIAPL
ncbi:hypothetical protein T439DRAFT_151421 [Meredithblackwellia eburnea MCA 4105]